MILGLVRKLDLVNIRYGWKSGIDRHWVPPDMGCCKNEVISIMGLVNNQVSRISGSGENRVAEKSGTKITPSCKGIVETTPCHGC